MNILNLSLGQDTGGQQMRLARAWAKMYPEDTYISATSTHTFYEIQHQFHISKLQDWWEAADLVHMNNDLRFIERFRKLNLPPRPVAIHHHGTMYRTRPEYHLEALRQYNALGLCSTVDLWAIAPTETVWLPQAYEPEELEAYIDRAPPDAGVTRPLGGGRALRVAHAPTNRPIKSTKALVDAVHRLQRIGVKIELDIIEKVSNVECLRRKGRADVFVDQLILGYGCNAIEAWGMGIPVVAGIDIQGARQKIRQQIPEDTDDRMLEQWGVYPWYSAKEETLHKALLQLTDPVVRDSYRAKGLDHFYRHHSAEVVLPYLRGLYTDHIAGYRDKVA